QAGSGPFNLSLGVAVSGELSGQNPEDWYYLGILMIWRTSVLMAISMMVRGQLGLRLPGNPYTRATADGRINPILFPCRVRA
nr:hypothetical protein [Candidatus Freyarchaeota archaeon]